MEELQCFWDAGPFQHHEDPPVVDAGERAEEVGEKDARVFRIASAHGDGHYFDFLGDAPLRRVKAIDGVSP